MTRSGKRYRCRPDTTISVSEVRYHRNGVAGESFWSVLFTFDDEDGVSHRMVGTVGRGDLREDEDGEPVGMAPGFHGIRNPDCRVIDLDSPGQRWRGDHFYPGLVRAIVAHNRAEVRAEIRAMSA